MNRHWTPESRVTVTDAGVVIELELSGVQIRSLEITRETNRLCIRGQHDDHGSFEVRFDVPSGHSLTEAEVGFANGVLRIEMPPDKGAAYAKPRAMLIYCNECGKHFDIVITVKGPQKYRCPACGQVQVFDLDDLVKKVLEQSRKMLRKKRRGR